MRAYLKQPLVISTLLACLCGLLTIIQPLDQGYWNTRFRFGQTAAPQSIVLVTQDSSGDDAEQRSAAVLEALGRSGARQVYFDRTVSEGSPALARGFRALGDRLSVVVRFSKPDTVSAQYLVLPNPALVPPQRVVVSGWFTNFWGFATDTVYLAEIKGRTYPTLSAAIAEHRSGLGDRFRPDFSIDPATVRTIADSDVLTQPAVDASLRGATVIMVEPREGPTAVLGYFAHGRIDPVYVDVAGAVGAAQGLSINIEWLPLVALFVVCTAAVQRIRRRPWRLLGYSGVAIITCFGPVLLQLAGIYSNPSASILAAAFFVAAKLWSKWRKRVLETSRSGLPNFVALTAQELPPQHDIVVAIIGRYEEFLATLPSELHGECARQIARRFSVGCGAREIYHGEGGMFAWSEATRPVDRQIENLEGLRALFAAPLLVGSHVFDTNVHFGLERNHDLDVLTRVNTALASAADALKHGRTVELFEAKRLANAAWELSLLARIDEGMRNGDIWLAYQSQWDYGEARLSGAEALIRWNDPVRGPIRPDEFILQAEQAGRIDALTYWVFEQAITSAERINALGPTFQMSINLSAQLVDKSSLVSSVAEIVRRRGIDCRLFTIEVTETAGMCNRPAAIRNLQQLRAMGFRLSIDDFGTGEASLSYLAELPSDELKLDRRFVSKIVHHERERQIVASTINLAHALRQTVVAEGIEDLPTFELLREMGCDAGQGYYIARPETFDQLMQRYTALARDLIKPSTLVNHSR